MKSPKIAEKRLAAKKLATKRRRNKLILRWTVGVVSVAAVAAAVIAGSIATSQQNEAKEKEASSLQLNTPSLATAVGSFAVNSAGKAVPLDEADSSVPRIEFVFDPQCPGCQIVETGTHDEVESLMESGEAQFFFTPVSFLNGASTDDYSARAASTAIEVAQSDPDHFYDYISAIYEEENFPGEGANYPRGGVSYADLGETARAAGVSDEAIAKFDEQNYRLWVLENTKVNAERTEVFPQGISTPTVLMGGELQEEGDKFVLKDFLKVPFQDSDVAKTFRDSFAQISG